MLETSHFINLRVRMVSQPSGYMQLAKMSFSPFHNIERRKIQESSYQKVNPKKLTPPNRGCLWYGMDRQWPSRCDGPWALLRPWTKSQSESFQKYQFPSGFSQGNLEIILSDWYLLPGLESWLYPRHQKIQLVLYLLPVRGTCFLSCWSCVCVSHSPPLSCSQ